MSVKRARSDRHRSRITPSGDVGGKKLVLGPCLHEKGRCSFLVVIAEGRVAKDQRIINNQLPLFATQEFVMATDPSWQLYGLFAAVPFLLDSIRILRNPVLPGSGPRKRLKLNKLDTPAIASLKARARASRPFPQTGNSSPKPTSVIDAGTTAESKN